jgi:hypothetical protein
MTTQTIDATIAVQSTAIRRELRALKMRQRMIQQVEEFRPDMVLGRLEALDDYELRQFWQSTMTEVA